MQKKKKKKKKGFDELFDRQSKWDEEIEYYFQLQIHILMKVDIFVISGHFCQEFFLAK